MGFIISLLLLEITGIFFLSNIITRARYRYSLTELVSLSFFIGVFFISFQTLMLYFLGQDLRLPHVVAMPSLMLILVLSRYLSRPERMKDFSAAPVKPGYTYLEKALLLGIILQLLWVIFLVLPTPVHSHDAVANYALKAKMLYAEGMVPAGFFSLSEATVSHSDYPPLLPFLMNWIYSFTGFNDLSVNMIMPVLYAMFLLLFYSLIRKLFSRTYSLMTVFLLATIPQLYDYAAIIHTDLILTALVTCGSVYFFLYMRSGSRTQALLSSVLFGTALWVKNEAIVFVGAFLLVFFMYSVKRELSGTNKRRYNDLIAVLTTIALMAGPWFFVKSCQASVNSDMSIAEMTSNRILANVKDIPVLLDLFQQEVFGPKKWNIFWVMAGAVFIWKRKDLWRENQLYVTLFILVSAAGYFVGYMMTTGNNLFFYVNTTISRFMLHFTGITLFAAAVLCGEEAEKMAN